MKTEYCCLPAACNEHWWRLKLSFVPARNLTHERAQRISRIMFDRKQEVNQSNQEKQMRPHSWTAASASMTRNRCILAQKKALLSTTKHTQVRSNTRIEVQIQVISKTTPQHPHGTWTLMIQNLESKPALFLYANYFNDSYQSYEQNFQKKSCNQTISKHNQDLHAQYCQTLS